MLNAKAQGADPHKEIPFGRPMIDDEDRAAVMEVLNGHILTHGPKCKEFEDKFAAYVGGGYAVSTSSCMASLHLSALHFGLKAGDEVIVPSQTHVATVHAVEITGATPVFVDCDILTGNMDIAKIEQSVTPRTKAIFLVHFNGIPVEMDKVCAIADKHGLAVIEDCALAVGALYKGKHVGLWGDTGCYSFYPVKHITTAEGGMLISKNEKTVKEIANFRAFSYDKGQGERKIPGIYDVVGVGLNYRMSEMQGALGCVQVGKIDRILAARAANFAALKEQVLAIDGISHILESRHPDVQSSHYCLTAVFDEKFRALRNDIILRLMERKIGCSVYYPQPVPRTKYYGSKYGAPPETYANAAIISDGAIALPVGPHLETADMTIISDNLKDIMETL